MVKIISTFRGVNPISQSLSNLGKSLYGDSTANAINSERLYALERANTETDELGKMLATGGAAALASNPLAQARLLTSGYKPSDFGAIGLMDAAARHGAASPEAQNMQVGTGQAYDNTADAFNTKQAEVTRNNNLQSSDRRYGVDQGNAEKRYEFSNKPTAVMGPEGPTFAPQGNISAGVFTPIMSESDVKGGLLGKNFDNLDTLSPEQRQVLGANPSTGPVAPKNYIVTDPVTGKSATFLTADGKTDLQSGQPLPAGGYIGNVQGSASDTGVTNSVLSGEQQKTIENRKFKYLLGEADKLTSDPTLFGAQGAVRSLGQEVAAGVSGLAQAFKPGSTGDDVLQEARANLASHGLSQLLPELYDPNLSKVQTLWGLLVYQGASALAGQQNRSVSDKDIKEFKNILGDPQSFFSSAPMMHSKLMAAQDIIDNYDQISREALGGKAPVTPGADVTGTDQPTPIAQPQADPLAQARDAIAKGADRAAVIKRLQSMGIDPGGL